MSGAQLGRAAGLSQSAVSRIERGLREPGAATLGRLAAAMNVSADYLLGLTDVPDPASKLAARFGQSHGRPVGRWRGLKAAAGGGAIFDSAERDGYETFESQRLERLGVNPDRCIVIDVTGESMEPTLPDGSYILVDRGRRTLRANRVFVVATEDGVVVKRLARSGSRWFLASDHPKWKSVPWPSGAAVVGEVVWVARGLA